MSIRINLLAEAQALEDLRRRDPVKRALWTGLILLILLLAWSSSIQLKAIIAKGELNRVEAQLNAREAEFKAVLDKQSKLGDMNHRLQSVNQLACNRLLQASILDALEHTLVDSVRLIRIRTEQSYVMTDAVKAATNGTKITPARPATSTERIVLTLEARDTSPNPGDQVNRFKEALVSFPYFQKALGSATNEVRLASLSPPQSVAEGKPFVSFTLECRYPEITR